MIKACASKHDSFLMFEEEVKRIEGAIDNFEEETVKACASSSLWKKFDDNWKTSKRFSDRSNRQNSEQVISFRLNFTRFFTFDVHSKAEEMRPPAYNGDDMEQISQEQGERNVAMAVCVQLAGRAIIRVVSRCEEAQDNCNLGRSNLSLHQRFNTNKILICSLVQEH